MRTGRSPSAPRLASVGIALFLASCLFAGFIYGDLYPFSHFPMYSTARTTPYEPARYELVGVSSDGERTAGLAAPLGTSLFPQWVQDAEEDPESAETLGSLLLSHNRRRNPDRDLAEVRILRHDYVIPEHPRPGRPEKLGTEVIYETGP